jgi:DNA-binding NarL/FixJ family response regulator
LSKKLLKQQPGLKIIALTNFEDLSFVKRMLKNGVHGYLLKNTDKLELISALKAVLSGDIYLQKDLQKRLLLNDTKSNSKNQLIPKLTRREQEVLQAIAEELTTKEISEKLFISPKTVETHRMNLMSKLGAKNSVGIIKIALENELL